MATLQKTVVQVEIGPLQRSTGFAYVHDLALDGDENLAVGDHVEIVDGAGKRMPATVTSIDPALRGNMYQLKLQ